MQIPDPNSDTPIHIVTSHGEFWVRPGRVTAITDGPAVGLAVLQTSDGNAIGVRGVKSELAKALGFPVTETPKVTQNGLHLA